VLKPPSHWFRNKRWTLKWRRPRRSKEEIVKDLVTLGKTDPNVDTVTISPYEVPVVTLETVIHEGLHACVFDLDEECVNETTMDIVRLLLRMGMSISFNSSLEDNKALIDVYTKKSIADE
jgi:hypothetical protein